MMQRVQFVLLVVLMVFSQAITAQKTRETNVPPLAPPHITDTTPDWARLMYSPAPNVYEVDRLYIEYYQRRDFAKTTDTRNYKHWRNYISRYDMVQPDGSILVPTHEEREAETQNYIQKRAEMDGQTAERSAGPTSAWEQIGPYENTGTGNYGSNQSCQVAFAQSLSNLNVLYSVSQNGKVFKTINHGDTWAAVGENYFFDGDTYSKQTITVHPSNPDTVLYATTNRVWKTNDGGTTWSTTFTASGLQPNCLIINPVNPNIVLMSSELGIYRSTNGGVNFTLIRAGYSFDLRFKTNDPNIVFAICRNGTKSDFYRSTDGGVTWAPSLTGWFSLPQDSDGGGRMTVSTGNPNLIYCIVLGRVTGDPAASSIVGIARSLNAGLSWTELVSWNTAKRWTGTGTDSLLIDGGQGYYDLDIEVSDSDDNLLLFGTQNSFRTTNAFATIVSVRSTIGQHSDVQDMHFNGPNDMWVASDGGMDLYNATLTSRLSKSKGISGTEFWGFDQGWNEDSRAGSYYHNGVSAYRAGYPNNQFRSLAGGEPSTGYISVGEPNKMWWNEVGGRYLPPTLLGNVTSFGYNKFPNESYWSQQSRSEIVPHPQYYNTHFLGRDNVLWKTTDGGASFTSVYTFGTVATSIVTAIEISRSNPQIMLVCQGGKLWRTTNGGTTFTEIAQPAGAPTSAGAFITLSPTNPDHFWIAYRHSTSPNKVFRTINGGANWTNLTTSVLTNLRPNGIMHAGGTDDGIYLMLQHAVVYRNNTHTNWQPFNTGLPLKLENNFIRPFYKEGKIRMATLARGLWSVDMYEAPTTVIVQATVDKAVSNCSRDTFFFNDYSMVNHTGASWSWAFPGASTIIGAATRTPKVLYTVPGVHTATMTLTTPLGTFTSSINVTVGAGCDPDTIAGKVLRTYANEDKFVAAGTKLTNLTHFTITGWWKPNGPQQAYAALFSNGEWCGACAEAQGLVFDYYGNKLWYRWPGNENQWAWNSGIDIPLNEWSYVALVITPTGATLYLNDKKHVHNQPLLPGSFENINIGYGHYSKSFKGDIDEVTIWKRALTETEIRRLRHITKEDVIPTDPTLVGYWQFNEIVNGQIQDNASSNHGALVNGPTLEVSTAPVGGGEAQLLPLVNNTFAYNFNQVGTEVQLSDCDALTGSVVATRLNIAPNLAPNANPTAQNTWFLDFYTNQTAFTALESLKLTASDAAFVSGIATPNEAVVHARSVNSGAATWLPRAKGIAKTGSALTFNRKAQITSEMQFSLTDGSPAFTETDPGSPCGLNDGPKKALRTYSNGNYARTTSSPQLGNTNTFTVSVWIKPDGTQPGWAGLFSAFNNSGAHAISLNYTSTNKLSYHYNDESGPWQWGGGPTVTPGVWSHLVLTIEPTKAVYYLDGVPFTRTATHAPVNFNGLAYIGNHIGFSDRTFNGEIDEIKVFNRTLTPAEVRELRHLTYPSYATNDPSLISYYKMNESSGQIYDRVGNTNATLLGSATRLDENGPFERGVSQRISVTAANITANFANANLSITFGATVPNGELCVSRIDSLPVGVITNQEVIGGKYWIVNNHGTNNSTFVLNSMTFSGLNVNSSVPGRYRLYKRSSNSHLATDWVGVDGADAVTTGTNGSITFSTGLVVNSFSQFAIFEKGVRVAAKVFLQGSYNATSGLMDDNLRANNLTPTAEPYTALSFGHVEGGGETIAASVLAATGNNAIVDWVFLELRDKTNPATKLYTRAALLQKDGDIVDLDGVSSVHFANALADDYYLAVKHRNHLGARTPSVLTLSENATSYDFTTAQTTAYQNTAIASNQALVALNGTTVFGLQRGNADGNNLLDAADATLGRNQSTPNQAAVYNSSDINMDGIINVLDAALTKSQSTPTKTAHL
jgi:photosystem II stability/assembly factor-like uncharacterized protein